MTSSGQRIRGWATATGPPELTSTRMPRVKDIAAAGDSTFDIASSRVRPDVRRARLWQWTAAPLLSSRALGSGAAA